MKSTERLVDNLLNNDFRKCKVDLQKAVEHVMKQRVSKKKEEFVSRLNQK
jgi:hypothetical protein